MKWITKIKKTKKRELSKSCKNCKDFSECKWVCYQLMNKHKEASKPPPSPKREESNSLEDP